MNTGSNPVPGKDSQIKKKAKKKRPALDRYVIFSIGALIVYTIISLCILILRGQTADTLTACFFAFFGGEIVTCALIKIFKLKEENPKPKEPEIKDTVIEAIGFEYSGDEVEG